MFGMVEMDLFGIAITTLAAILTYQAWKNGRWMKQSHKETTDWMRQSHEETQELIKGTQEMIKGTQEMIKGTQELIKGTQEMIKGTQEMIKGTQEMIKEMHKDTQETLKGIALSQSKMDDTLKEITQLIIAEGVKIRQAIKA